MEEVPESEEKSREKSRGEAEKSQEQDTPQQVTSPKAPQMEESKINPPPLPSAKSHSQSQSPKNNTTIKPAPDAHQPSPVTETEAQPQSEPNVPYTRNYIILSQIPGGLPAELQIVLGSHVEWDKLKIIPSRNRPISVFLYIYRVVDPNQLTTRLNRSTNPALPFHQPPREIQTPYHPHPIRYQRRIRRD